MAGTERVLQQEITNENWIDNVPLKGTADMMCVDSANKSYIVEAKHTNSIYKYERSNRTIYATDSAVYVFASFYIATNRNGKLMAVICL